MIDKPSCMPQKIHPALKYPGLLFEINAIVWIYSENILLLSPDFDRSGLLAKAPHWF